MMKATEGQHMGDGNKPEVITGLNTRIARAASSRKEKGGTTAVEGSTRLPRKHSRMLSAKGKVGGGQDAASEGDYVVEVRILARCYSENPQDPLATEFTRHLDEEVKRQLIAIAERYPQTS
jgi:hypothetical protein